MKESRVSRARGAQRGFTLMEMLLVVLIIALLAAMMVPRLVPQAEQAKVKIARVEIEANLPAALDLFMLNVGRYPTTEEGLEASLVAARQRPARCVAGTLREASTHRGPLEQAVSVSLPSGPRGIGFDLVSTGPDGVADTQDDITNFAQP